MSLNEEERKIIVGLEIEKSRKTFSEIEILRQAGLWDNIANRLYYAAFHAVIALLINDGHPVGTHQGAVVMLHQHYIKTSLQSARRVSQDQIESLFNILVEVGCLDNKEDVLLALAVRLTGRKLMPEPIPPIEWLGEESELDYLIFRLTPAEQKPAYSRYKHFFKDYNPSGAARRTAKGMVRPEVIAGLDRILPEKDRPGI